MLKTPVVVFVALLESFVAAVAFLAVFLVVVFFAAISKIGAPRVGRPRVVGVCYCNPDKAPAVLSRAIPSTSSVPAINCDVSESTKASSSRCDNPPSSL